VNDEPVDSWKLFPFDEGNLRGDRSPLEEYGQHLAVDLGTAAIQVMFQKIVNELLIEFTQTML